jgi:hypothetical protein
MWISSATTLNALVPAQRRDRPAGERRARVPATGAATGHAATDRTARITSTATASAPARAPACPRASTDSGVPPALQTTDCADDDRVIRQVQQRPLTPNPCRSPVSAGGIRRRQQVIDQSYHLRARRHQIRPTSDAGTVTNSARLCSRMDQRIQVSTSSMTRAHSGGRRWRSGVTQHGCGPAWWGDNAARSATSRVAGTPEADVCRRQLIVRPMEAVAVERVAMADRLRRAGAAAQPAAAPPGRAAARAPSTTAPVGGTFGQQPPTDRSETGDDVDLPTPLGPTIATTPFGSRTPPAWIRWQSRCAQYQKQG